MVHSVNYPFTYWNNWSPFSESPFFFTHNRIFIIKKSIFSGVVMKHTISKRNKPLSWHRNFTRITSLTSPGQDIDTYMIFYFFIFYKYYFHNTYGPGRWGKIWVRNVRTFFHPKQVVVLKVLAVNSNDVDCFITKILLWSVAMKIRFFLTNLRYFDGKKSLAIRKEKIIN